MLKRIPAEVFALDDQIVPAVPAQDQVIEATEPMNDEKAADVDVQEERRLPESEKEKKEVNFRDSSCHKFLEKIIKK